MISGTDLITSTMTEYENIEGADTSNSDFMSMYMSQSSCSSVRAQVSELSFAPSPVKTSHRTYSEHSSDYHNNTGFMNGTTNASLISSSSSVPFCTRDTLSQSLKYLNQVHNALEFYVHFCCFV